MRALQVLVFVGVVSVVGGASYTCNVDGIEHEEFEEWEEGECTVCTCIAGEPDCDDLCSNGFEDNPCYKSVGALCAERGCYDIFASQSLPIYLAPKVPFGEVKAYTDMQCTCEEGYPYIMCAVS